MNLEKLKETRDFISDLLLAYVVYDKDYESFGQAMSYYANELVYVLDTIITDLSEQKEISLEGANKGE